MAEIFDIQEFFIEGGKERDSHVLLHIAEPSSSDEAGKGYFFAVTEIRHGTVGLIERCQQLIDDLQTRYYGAADGNSKDAFERAVEYANRRSHHLAQFPGAEIHCVVGVLRENKLSLSAHGEPGASLVYRRGDETEYINIIGDDHQNSERLFSAILEGAVGEDDTLFISTTGVGAVFPPDKIKTLVAGRTLKEAGEHIERVLKGLRDGASYGGLFFRLSPATSASKADENRKPKAGRDNRAIAKSLPGLSQMRHSLLPILRLSAGRSVEISLAIARKLFRLARSAARGAASAAVFLFIVATNKGGQRSLVLEEMRAKLIARKKRLVALPATTKLLFLSAAVCVALLAIGLFWNSWREKQRVAALRIEAISRAINEKRDEADARLIYGENERVYALLQDALGLIPELASAEPAYGARYEEQIRARMDSVVSTLRKWRNIQSETIARVRDAYPDSAISRLAMLSGKIFAYGHGDDRLYRLDPETKTVDVIPHDAIRGLSAHATPKEEKEIVFASGDGAAAYEKEGNRVVVRDISFPADTARIADLFVYNQRLFTLDPINQQIYKHARTQTGYDRGAPWVKDVDRSALADAVSLAIDGDIFVATSKGMITKWAAGARQPFSTPIDPPLGAVARVWTYNNVARLYILDPAGKRLIVLNKNGALIAQYSDPAWKAPADMAVDEVGKTAYVLDDNVVYRVKLAE